MRIRLVWFNTASNAVVIEDAIEPSVDAPTLDTFAAAIAASVGVVVFAEGTAPVVSIVVVAAASTAEGFGSEGPGDADAAAIAAIEGLGVTGRVVFSFDIPLSEFPNEGFPCGRFPEGGTVLLAALLDINGGTWNGIYRRYNISRYFFR